MAPKHRKGHSPDSTSSRPSDANGRTPKPFTLEHFRLYAEQLVLDNDEPWELEDFQAEIVSDIFAGFKEVWILLPEGNAKTTLMSGLALYGLDYTLDPWIPIGAAAQEQARILHEQAAGFVRRSGLEGNRFKVYDGYLRIVSVVNGGVGIKVYSADKATGDGVIPAPYCFVDEGHRARDLGLYRTWKGKLRKRGAQIIMASTAGEPETDFEKTRDHIREKATKRSRATSYLRAEGQNVVMHEFKVESTEKANDLELVKAANPLSTVSIPDLREKLESPTLDRGQDWIRMTCNIPSRRSESAITDREWDEADVGLSEWDAIAGESVDVGLDVAWKWDTTALASLHKGAEYRLLGPARILVPPRDGSTLHPDEIKSSFLELAEANPILTVIMDTSKAEDLHAWLEDELGVEVIEWGTSNRFAVQDYNNVMDGLRNGTLKHTGDAGLRAHAMNAVARRLPGGDYRFDRPNASRGSATQQDRRVIDALTAAGMVTSLSAREEPQESVYETRGLMTA
jgi:hypothetical protein